MKPKHTKFNLSLLILGLVLTSAYLLIIFVFQSERIWKIGDLNLNEFGDFLAGAVGPLALLWLILGFLQQGVELRNSVYALELQTKELAASVEHQRELVVATRQQAEQEFLRVQQENQPSFVLAAAGHSGGPDGAKHRFSLFNAGAPATNLEVTGVYRYLVNAEIVRREKEPIYRNPIVKEGEKVDFSVILKDSKRKIEDYSFEIGFQTVDGRDILKLFERSSNSHFRSN